MSVSIRDSTVFIIFKEKKIRW